MHWNALALYGSLIQAAIVFSAEPGGAGSDEFSHINLAELRRDFAKSIPKGFEPVKDGLVRGPGEEPWWLVFLRLDRPGFYVLRHSYVHADPVSGKTLPHSRGDRCFYLSVGNRSTPRLHHVGSHQDYTYPLACVGDTLAIPIKVARRFADHRFFRDDPSSASAKLWAETDQRLSDPNEWFWAGQGKVTIRLKSEGSLLLVQSGVQSSVSRGLHFYVHKLLGLFEVTGQGEFGLAIAVPENGRRPPSRAVATRGAGRSFRMPPSMVVAAQDTPLVLLANRIAVREQHGEPPSFSYTHEWLRAGAQGMRIGDLMVLDCFEYRTEADRGRPEVLEHPIVDISIKPLSVRTWPFGFSPLSNATGEPRTSAPLSSRR